MCWGNNQPDRERLIDTVAPSPPPGSARSAVDQTTADGNLVIRTAASRDTYADGINLDTARANSIVQNTTCSIRDEASVVWSINGTTWSEHASSTARTSAMPAGRSTIARPGAAVELHSSAHTVQCPCRANCFSPSAARQRVRNSVCDTVAHHLPASSSDNELPLSLRAAQTDRVRTSLCPVRMAQMFHENTANPVAHGALKFLQCCECSVGTILVQDVDTSTRPP